MMSNELKRDLFPTLSCFTAGLADWHGGCPTHNNAQEPLMGRTGSVRGNVGMFGRRSDHPAILATVNVEPGANLLWDGQVQNIEIQTSKSIALWKLRNPCENQQMRETLRLN
jgi:hypothetical protein